MYKKKKRRKTQQKWIILIQTYSKLQGSDFSRCKTRDPLLVYWWLSANGLPDLLVSGEYIWNASHMRTFFLTLWIFWGITVAHLSQAELLIIMAELCVETPKQRSAAKSTIFCPQSLFFLFTFTKRRESPSMLLSDALSLSDAKTSVWIYTAGTEAVTYHPQWHHTAQIFKHMLTRDLPKLPRL